MQRELPASLAQPPADEKSGTGNSWPGPPPAVPVSGTATRHGHLAGHPTEPPGEAYLVRLLAVQWGRRAAGAASGGRLGVGHGPRGVARLGGAEREGGRPVPPHRIGPQPGEDATGFFDHPGHGWLLHGGGIKRESTLARGGGASQLNREIVLIAGLHRRPVAPAHAP